MRFLPSFAAVQYMR